MKRLIVGITLILGLLVGTSPALAISTPPGYGPKPTPCEARANGRPVYEHLSYWAAQGWTPWSYAIWRTDSGLICRTF